MGITTSISPNFTTSGDDTRDDHVGGNRLNEAQWWRRITFQNPDFGTLGMLGIYGAFGSILKPSIEVGPNLSRKSLNFAISAAFLAGIYTGFRRFRSKKSLVSDVVRD